MTKLETTASSELREALDGTVDAKATQRLMVAIAYKDGVPVSRLSRRYGIPESTIYYWLERIESKPLSEAIHDETRPGRPPKLTDAQREEVAEWLKGSPKVHDFDRDEWSVALLRERIRDVYDVDYSTGHVRRLFEQLDSN